MKIIKRESKFFTMMVVESIMFTIATVILLAVTIVALFYIFFVYKADYLNTPFEDNQKAFQEARFDAINIEDQLGKGSAFYIFDNHEALVYSSKTGPTYPFTYKATLLMPEENYDQDRIISSLSNQDQEKVYQINYSSNDDINAAIPSLDYTVIVAIDGHVLYSSRADIMGQLTSNELMCLLAENEDFKFLRKEFTTKDQETYQVVFFNHIDRRDTMVSRLLVTAGYMLPAIIIVLFLMIGLFLYRLNRKVNKPLLLLENAIANFNIGHDNGQIVYKGPKEFQEICSKFNSMSTRLNESLKENQKILGDITHDLKTPITILQSFSGAIKDGLVSEEDQGEYLEIIHQKSIELGALISTFNEYTKLFREDYKMDLTKVEINEYLRNIMIKKYNEIEFLGFELDIDIDECQAYCHIDSFHFDRVLYNLMSNSMKYNEKGTKIYLKLTIKDTMISIQMGDNGVGIESHLRSKLFNAFTIGDEARSNPLNTGLGLSIVQKIVDLHGGSIHLMDQEESPWSVAFDIQLPRLA